MHEISKGRVTSSISHSWVKNDGSLIIQVDSLCRSGDYGSRYLADLDETSDNRHLKNWENNLVSLKIVFIVSTRLYVLDDTWVSC